MFSFSLDEQTHPITIEGTPTEHWKNMGQGTVLPFAHFPVVDGRIGQGWGWGFDGITGDVVRVEMMLPQVPAHWVAEAPEMVEVVEGEWQELPATKRWIWFLLGVLLFLYWLKFRIGYE